jgi:hypothetical protein
MGNILVSLISDQAIPNLEMIKEKPVDSYLFILTEQMKEKLGWLKEAAGLNDSSVIQELIVDAFSFEDIDKKLSDIVSDDHHYLVNLTGGTKIMSLAVSDFFKNMDCELLYIPGKNDSYVRIFPGIKKPYFSFKTKITLEEYILAYGFTIRHKGSLLTSTEQTEKVFNYFLNHFNHEKDGEALKILYKKREEKKSFQHFTDDFEVPGFLTRLHFIPNQPDYLSKSEIKYLTGEWFEDYVYTLVKNFYKLSEEEIGVGWHLQKGENNVPNEFDVLFIKDKKLNIIECKTSVFSSAVDKKNIITETIYKVDALRNNLGLFAKTNIFTLSDLNKSDASIKSSIDRAKEFKIMICGKADFQDENFPKNIFK